MNPREKCVSQQTIISSVGASLAPKPGGPGQEPQPSLPLPHEQRQPSGGDQGTVKKAQADEDNLDEFDDLTTEELKSLLDNFKNLSKGEQKDLVSYMRKLETTDPMKVPYTAEKSGTRPSLTDLSQLS